MILQIDALYLLLLGESALLLLILTIFFSVRSRKYRKLYQKSLESAGGVKDETPPAPVASAQTEPAPADTGEAALPPGEEPVQEQAAPAEADPSAFGEEGAAAAWEEMPEGQLKRLRRMLEYQKNVILDLMCYKDIFESAQKKMASLRQVNEELQEKIRSLIAAGMEVPGTGSLENALESSNQDLEKYIGLLEKENTRLIEKFRTWEEEFRRIAEDMGDGGGSGESGGASVYEGRYAEIVKEKEELEAKVKSLEDRIKEQTKQIDDVQKQYEDLEKEYMILYREQQKQKEQPDLPG